MKTILNAGQARIDKLTQLKRSQEHQQQGILRYKDVSQKATKISFAISETLAKHQKPFSDGVVAQEVLQCFTAEASPEMQELVSQVQLSRATVSRRVEALAADICSTLRVKCKAFEFYSIALDESTDCTDTAQLCVFIRGVDKDANITEEFLGLGSMKDTTTGKDIFNHVIKILNQYELPLEKLAGLCTDGAPAMRGVRNGFTTLMKEHVLANIDSPETHKEPMTYHCIIHQEQLISATSLHQLKPVMDKVISTVNFIRSRGLNHRQFQALLDSLEKECSDVVYHCKVRWLSSSATLKRFWDLLDIISDFMQQKGKPCDEFTDDGWLNNLAFLVDITGHLRELNLQLQGKDQVIATMYERISAFQEKLRL